MSLESPVLAANLGVLYGFLEVGDMGNRLFSGYLSQEMKCCSTQRECHDPPARCNQQTKEATRLHLPNTRFFYQVHEQDKQRDPAYWLL